MAEIEGWTARVMEESRAAHELGRKKRESLRFKDAPCAFLVSEEKATGSPGRGTVPDRIRTRVSPARSRLF